MADEVPGWGLLHGGDDRGDLARRLLDAILPNVAETGPPRFRHHARLHALADADESDARRRSPGAVRCFVDALPDHGEAICNAHSLLPWTVACETDGSVAASLPEKVTEPASHRGADAAEA